jgi:hypothetical protein
LPEQLLLLVDARRDQAYESYTVTTGFVRPR